MSQIRRFFDLVRVLVGEEKFDLFRTFRPGVDYVGPEGANWKPPQTIYGVDVRPAAWVHDELYRIGGCEEDRERADIIFHTLMLQLIEDHHFSWWQVGFRFLARYRATSYYEAVRIGGAEHFSDRRKSK